MCVYTHVYACNHSSSRTWYTFTSSFVFFFLLLDYSLSPMPVIIFQPAVLILNIFVKNVFISYSVRSGWFLKTTKASYQSQCMWTFVDTKYSTNGFIISCREPRTLRKSAWGQGEIKPTISACSFDPETFSLTPYLWIKHFNQNCINNADFFSHESVIQD